MNGWIKSMNNWIYWQIHVHRFRVQLANTDKTRILKTCPIWLLWFYCSSLRGTAQVALFRVFEGKSRSSYFLYCHFFPSFIPSASDFGSHTEGRTSTLMWLFGAAAAKKDQHEVALLRQSEARWDTLRHAETRWSTSRHAEARWVFPGVCRITFPQTLVTIPLQRPGASAWSMESPQTVMATFEHFQALLSCLSVLPPPSSPLPSFL